MRYCSLLHVTGWAVAQSCSISQCAKYRNGGIFGYPWYSKPLNPSLQNLVCIVVDVVVDPTLTSEYGSDRAACGSWRMREISLFVTFFCFIFFRLFSPLPPIVCLFLPSDFLLLDVAPFLSLVHAYETIYT